MKRVYKSVSHATQGLRTAFREEMNIRIHSVIAILAVILGFYFQISAGEWLIIILSIAMVLSLEIINSIFERIIDILKPSANLYVKEMKDMIAGSVLLAAMAAAVIGLVIFLPKIFQ